MIRGGNGCCETKVIMRGIERGGGGWDMLRGVVGPIKMGVVIIRFPEKFKGKRGKFKKKVLNDG